LLDEYSVGNASRTNRRGNADGEISARSIEGAKIVLGQSTDEAYIRVVEVSEIEEYTVTVEVSVSRLAGFVCLQDKKATWEVDLDVGVSCDRAGDIESNIRIRTSVRGKGEGDAEDEE